MEQNEALNGVPSAAKQLVEKLLASDKYYLRTAGEDDKQAIILRKPIKESVDGKDRYTYVVVSPTMGIRKIDFEPSTSDGIVPSREPLFSEIVDRYSDDNTTYNNTGVGSDENILFMGGEGFPLTQATDLDLFAKALELNKKEIEESQANKPLDKEIEEPQANKPLDQESMLREALKLV